MRLIRGGGRWNVDCSAAQAGVCREVRKRIPAANLKQKLRIREVPVCSCLAGDARAAGHRPVRCRRDRAIRLINRPHKLLGDQLPDVRAVRLHVAVRGREVARLADAVLDILQAPVLQGCVLLNENSSIMMSWKSGGRST